MAVFAPQIRTTLTCFKPFLRTRSLQYSHHSVHRQYHGIKPRPINNAGSADFAFAFDIDGVLLRSSNPLPRARETLLLLQKHRIPFILLTNGGGKHETVRVAEIMQALRVPLDTSMFIQSHTPFAEFVHGDEKTPALKDKCILVTGGDQDNCRKVAEDYGFTNVLAPADIINAYPDLMPFANSNEYGSYGRSLPRPIQDSHTTQPNPLKVDAIFIFNDPRDWALDIQLILDLLLSQAGIFGTLSPLNNNPSLPNRGYQQDGQPKLYFSNPDLFWAAKYHLPRLGQGGFREALDGVWKAVTGGEEKGVKLQKEMFGKPYQGTYEFAERRLLDHRKNLANSVSNDAPSELKRVYMVGDNPASDILGANQYTSLSGSAWHSVLVRSGVFSGGEPEYAPNIIVNDVWDAVQWGFKHSGWAGLDNAQVEK